MPSTLPSDQPSAHTSETPSSLPSEGPSPLPTSSHQPTYSASPSSLPTESPRPTVPPSEGPTNQQPTRLPNTLMPSTSRSTLPSTNISSTFPSDVPTISASPSRKPNGEPSVTPSDSPSSPPVPIDGVSSPCRSSNQYIAPDIVFLLTRLFHYFTQVTGECDEGTAILLSNEELVIETHALEAKINNTPQKKYCKAIPHEGRQCKLDYRKFPNNLQQLCEEAGGQHALSYYIATCIGTSYSLQLAVSNAPDCVATACRADDTTALLKEYATARVIARLGGGGGNFNCTLSHFRNRAPTALFAKQIAIQTKPPTPPQTPPYTPPRTPEPGPVQPETPSTYVPYKLPSTDAPKPEDPTVINGESSGGISLDKLNMLLAAVVAAFFLSFLLLE